MEAVQVVPKEQEVQKGLMVFTYEGIRLRESCWIEGKPYFTPRAIGEWLEYKFPREAINKLIKRNPHILTFSSEVNLTSELNTGKGTKYEREADARVFDPIGFQLIINKSNQPKAIAFQVAVAHLAYDYATGNLKPFKGSGDIAAALSQIISMRAGRERKLKIIELARELNKSKSTIYSMAEKLNGENLMTRAGKPKRTRKDKNSFCNRPEFQQVKTYLIDYPNTGGKEIKTVLGITYAAHTINRWIRYIRSHK